MVDCKGLFLTLYNEKKPKVSDVEAESSSEKSLSLAEVLDLSYFSDLEPLGLKEDPEIP